MAQDLILEARGLTKEFKGFVGVENVSLEGRRGTLHALLGPHGAGKTTCFNLLTHFLEPARGQILYNGRDITGARPAAIARMGLVRSFQISAVIPHLTVPRTCASPCSASAAPRSTSGVRLARSTP